jgi:hypothetical protein
LLCSVLIYIYCDKLFVNKCVWFVIIISTVVKIKISTRYNLYYA